MDDYFDDEPWKGSKKKTKKLNTNPSGPYTLDLMFKGINWNIVIENLNINDFKVTVKSDKKVKIKEIDLLKRYLQAEGFEMAAKKHNLFW
jgi:hypothetical protein